jgi:D-alanyl-D-alanine carboxypeptidase
MFFPSTGIDRRRFLGRAALASVAVALPFARRWGAEAQTTPAEPATPAATELEEAITASMEALSIPGANVLLDRPDTGTWTAAFGVADLQRMSPMSPDLHMRIGSITKTMTATVVLQLVDEGSFTLDDTLATLLPDVTNIPNAKQITVRHLLNMRSGIFDYLDDESFFPQVFADPTRPWTPREMIALAAKHDPEFAPGADFAYSNTNFVLLGLIVEDCTNQPIAAALERRLFAPVGMAHTTLPDDAMLPEPFAHGYVSDPRQDTGELVDWTVFNATAAWAAGGVVSTVGDLHTWLKALVDGPLLSAELQRERLAFTPVKRDPGEPSYGYGLGIANFDGQIGHDGSALGFNSLAVYRPETKESTIVLANLDPTKDGKEAAGGIARAVADTR